jgi:hypothetical protein
MYQRGYMWQKRHVEAFWQDIVTQQLASKLKGGIEQHFLGPIVTLWDSKDNVYYILDGQQRLATATILLCVIRDVAREVGAKTGVQALPDFAAVTQSQFIQRDDSLYSLELGQTDANYFRDTIQLDPPIATTGAKLRTHRNIKDAHKILHDKVWSLVNKKDPPLALVDLKDLRQVIASDLIMANIRVDTHQEAFRIFETLNDRGLRLSVPDLLLNYLMGKAPDTNHKDIRNLWTQMLERMGKHDISRFLRHMWVSNFGDLKKEDMFSALKKHIEEHSIASLDFARLCMDECEKYVQLITVDEDQLDKDAVPYVRALVRELDFQSGLPLLLSSYSLLQKDDFIKVTKWLLVFVTRYSIVSNLDSAGMEDLLFDLAREVRSKFVTKNGEPVDPGTSKRCAAIIKEVLSKNAPVDSAIIAKVPDLILDAGDAKYVVTRLARYMQSKTKEITLNESNLEHIFPQNPDEQEWGGKVNQEKLEPYLWHIGNLTIYGKRLNREAANKEFPIKREQYESKSEIEMTLAIARDYRVWDEMTIKDRATKLAKKVAEVWDFDNPSRV